MRHAYAGVFIGKEKNVPEDMNRKLEPEGIVAAQNLADYLSDNDMVPNAIRFSPIKRAKQTAKILGDAFGMKPIEDQNLEMTKPVGQAIKLLAADPSQKRILLVSHSDAIQKALVSLNDLDPNDVDPFATSELRVFDVKRKDGSWDEIDRVLPSDLGGKDYF